MKVVEVSTHELICILTTLNFIIKHGKTKVVNNTHIFRFVQNLDEKLDDIEVINRCSGVDLKVPITYSEIQTIAAFFRANKLED